MKLKPDERDLWERTYVAVIQAVLTRATADGNETAELACSHADRAVGELRKKLDVKPDDGPYRG